MSDPPVPEHIVSLVPCLTEALFALGLGNRVIGATDWCVHPKAALAALPKVGGPRTPSVERILALRPDLVLANREENRRQDVERLASAGIRVWITSPRSVDEGARLLRELAGLGATPEAIEAVVAPVERALAAAREQARPRATRVFCAVWKKPWMAVGGDTYADDLIALCGGRNVFAQCASHRYPVVEIADILGARPEVVLLPDEPYAFGPRDVQELAALDVPAARDGRIHLIDGTWVSWYGPRIERALRILPPLICGEPGT